MNDAAQAAPGWRWAPAWVLAFVVLWPAPGYAEGVLALGALDVYFTAAGIHPIEDQNASINAASSSIAKMPRHSLAPR